MTSTAGHLPPAAEPALTAVVCDEQLLFAEAFAEALRARGVRVATTAEAAVTARIAVRSAAATVVINPEPHPSAAASALRQIRRTRPETRLICLCNDGAEAAGRALEAYADLVLTKRRPLQELVDVVTSPPTETWGATPLPDARERPRSRPEPPPPLAAQFLNQREQQVLRLLARAESTQEMARRLGISVPTARGYIQSIFSKLGVHSRVEALNYAVRHSLVKF